MQVYFRFRACFAKFTISQSHNLTQQRQRTVELNNTARKYLVHCIVFLSNVGFDASDFYLFNLQRTFDFHFMFLLPIDWYADNILFLQFPRVIEIQIFLVISIHRQANRWWELWKPSKEFWGWREFYASCMKVQNKFKYTKLQLIICTKPITIKGIE